MGYGAGRGGGGRFGLSGVSNIRALLTLRSPNLTVNILQLEYRGSSGG
jgi:hypothetical protein